jgi:hypothetical protein
MGDTHQPGSGGEVVLVAFISKRFGHVHERTFGADQKQRRRQAADVAHGVVGVMLRLRKKVIEIFESVRSHSRDSVGDRECRQV